MNRKEELDSIMNSLCRICAQETNNNAIKLFDERGNIQRIAKKIIACFPFMIVDKTDHYPKQVCLNCASKLSTNWALYKRGVQGQKLLHAKMRNQMLPAMEGQWQTPEGQGETPAAPIPTTVGSPNNRRRVGGGRMCNYCHKTFPDDIFNHHVNLHRGLPSFTCVECNLDFQSEVALGGHRCAQPPPPPPPSPIDLDTDDDTDSDDDDTDSDDDLICI